MRIKKGKVKLDRRDVRIGNFVVRHEDGFIKFSDISGVITHRVSTDIPKGQYMLALYYDAKKGEERAVRSFENYICVMYNVLGCVPDMEFLTKINEECVACLKRHPEVYGVSPKVTDEEDAAILRNDKELREKEDEFREVNNLGDTK